LQKKKQRGRHHQFWKKEKGKRVFVTEGGEEERRDPSSFDEDAGKRRGTDVFY